VKPRHATEEEIAYFHTNECIQKVKDMSNTAMGGWVGPLVMCSPGSYEIALLSTGGCLAALDDIMAGKIRNAYALVRPPGHHAEAESPMGFCIFNNIVITARYAQKKYGLKRIAIVDWDVHHGNGTQKAFYNESSVLFISIHQNKNYPLGSSFRVPLPAKVLRRSCRE
jgi:acetoin utilization deacetylase AcuC-like enzyme